MPNDRVRMKSKSVFNNPLITVHAKEGEFRPDPHTVIEDDEFSTSEEHGKELERLGLAESTSGKAEPLSESASRLIGAQTQADNGAVAASRTTTTTTLGGKSKAS